MSGSKVQGMNCAEHPLYPIILAKCLQLVIHSNQLSINTAWEHMSLILLFISFFLLWKFSFAAGNLKECTEPFNHVYESGSVRVLGPLGQTLGSAKQVWSANLFFHVYSRQPFPVGQRITSRIEASLSTVVTSSIFNYSIGFLSFLISLF